LISWTQLPPEIPQTAFLVPIPIHRDRFLKRGFNLPDCLANHIAKTQGYQRAEGDLFKWQPTSPQSTLSAKAREKNLRGCFEWRGKCPDTVVLVDDVFTTGATIQTAARELKRAGCQEIYAWTLFRTPQLRDFTAPIEFDGINEIRKEIPVNPPK
jgi:predicted amidophosphoribosyltransferase